MDASAYCPGGFTLATS
ncbi:BgTH12-00138 [Blumeria graminis f. sp. triticale]|uniref:BgTH12-00138 n=1 Tax=Blumeria graminis f. sp. triticale TaxID=1689686 RepID=A0A9W4D2K2_BLUGR|nr:BgTH12-03991 [Blumeria graminis f. sp. triticale]CAD6502966.1 BgTH12-02640 [Blumeria graminis f. sp. triticale]CAD6503329.1 BgTH12-02996 [Blumeria graminis f. sp. triticale]CAD6504630.1 BgTH12-00138 [Blumeria graminis f. sp. triticale]